MRYARILLPTLLVASLSCDMGAGIDLDHIPLDEPALPPNEFINLRLRAWGQAGDNGPLHDCDLDAVWDSLPAGGTSGDSYRATASVSLMGQGVQAHAWRELERLRVSVSRASGDRVRITLRGPFQTTLFADRSPDGTGYSGQWRCPFDFPSARDDNMQDVGFSPTVARRGDFSFHLLPPPPSAPPPAR